MVRRRRRTTTTRPLRSCGAGPLVCLSLSHETRHDGASSRVGAGSRAGARSRVGASSRAGAGVGASSRARTSF